MHEYKKHKQVDRGIACPDHIKSDKRPHEPLTSI
jgi:hypothetical protein